MYFKQARQILKKNKCTKHTEIRCRIDTDIDLKENYTHSAVHLHQHQ